MPKAATASNLCPRAAWGVAKREEHGMAYRKAMWADPKTARHGGASNSE
jgi:hypothetical protein